MTCDVYKEISNLSEGIYASKNKDFIKELKEIIEKFQNQNLRNTTKQNLDNLSVLITYADSIKKEGEPSLKTLHHFLKKYEVKVDILHILPFFTSSSDDGFSVIDYRKINEKYGGWGDIKRLSNNYLLMADLVLNHVSSKSKWFQRYLKGNLKYKNYFISYDTKKNLSKVFRPRDTPLLTEYLVKDKKKYVWTTFSPDQIDLNYKNYKVLVEMIDTMLFYISKGISIIRLDAAAFIWKDLETSSFNIKKTHDLVKIFKIVKDYVAPNTRLIVEVNSSYDDNVSYIKNKESDGAYQFYFSPLILYSLIKEDFTYLKKAFRKVNKYKENFLNVTATHDGIGLLGVQSILKKKDRLGLVQQVTKNKGLVSYRKTRHGREIYELNINYFSALNNLNKFMLSQSIILFSQGLSGIYIHSLLGSRNDLKGYNESHIKRRINRQKLNYDKLKNELENKNTYRSKVFNEYKKMLNFKKSIKLGDQKILKTKKELIAIKRGNYFFVYNSSSKEIKKFGENIKPYSFQIFKKTIV